jgi:hypothetical protein
MRVDIPISADAQSAHLDGSEVPVVAVYPKIQSPQSSLAGQADSIFCCEARLFVAASKHENQFRKDLMQALKSLSSLKLLQTFALGCFNHSISIIIDGVSILQNDGLFL